jgi:hypothetical protein
LELDQDRLQRRQSIDPFALPHLLPDAYPLPKDDHPRGLRQWELHISVLRVAGDTAVT